MGQPAACHLPRLQLPGFLYACPLFARVRPARIRRGLHRGRTGPFCADDKKAATEPAKFTQEQVAFFEKEVLPVLTANCLKCHGAEEKVKGELNLTNRRAILDGGDRPGREPQEPGREPAAQGDQLQGRRPQDAAEGEDGCEGHRDTREVGEGGSAGHGRPHGDCGRREEGRRRHHRGGEEVLGVPAGPPARRAGHSECDRQDAEPDRRLHRGEVGGEGAQAGAPRPTRRRSPGVPITTCSACRRRPRRSTPSWPTSLRTRGRS